MTAEFTSEAMRLMRERSGGLCEVQWPNVCQGSGSQLVGHHRRPRGNGGTKRHSSRLAANGLMACTWCHTFLEAGERGEARTLGFIVDQNAEPADVAVFYRHELNVLLDNDGNLEAA
ncbi:hypothetical protein [Mycobacteroides abscessus]|uniref:hypothetical protein n=1 Tax=Mycobacteroides abscessus TaxID=36809 RepID=UPI00092BEEB1|nr:hypothetical protein [Mycobacteroides abscessus]QSM04877.1 HNH endonuclease [Mycobacterium phage prophi91-4]MDO3335125.1 hypothetical protein [Mycobacteroides abscessus subsp. bolletii]QSM87836.1 hypothetical protein I3U44_18750 [Mycobacteroides abscessus subsp. bolletii]SIB00962.1 Uncharacterised protein [Mycobacteroides abscessus subsp. bolletii]SII70094.1 Uncharacterised protein [Mycobacteroides abscessus subsp. bolletii]